MIKLSGETYGMILKQIPHAELTEFIDDHPEIPVGVSGIRAMEGKSEGVPCSFCLENGDGERVKNCHHYDATTNVYMAYCG